MSASDQLRSCAASCSSAPPAATWTTLLSRLFKANRLRRKTLPVAGSVAKVENLATPLGGGTRPRTARQLQAVGSSFVSTAHESDDVLDCFHGVRRDDLCARGAVGEHGIDIDGIGDEPLHLGIDRAEFDDREIDQRGLEGRELRAAEFVEDLRLALASKRGINANEVVGLGSLFESFLVVRQGIGIGLRPAD